MSEEKKAAPAATVHLEHIKGKPYHVRKRIVFGAAMGGTALIALVWFVGTLSAGTFAIHGSSFAQSTEQGNVMVAGNGNGNRNQNLAGTAAFAGGEQNSTGASAPAHIESIDTATSTSNTKQTAATTIPF